MVDLKELTPLAVELFVPDVTEATRYYVDTLGFTVLRTTPGDQPIFAIAYLGEAVVMFMHDRFYAGTRADLDYRVDGLRDFIMRDPFGFRLRFASALT